MQDTLMAPPGEYEPTWQLPDTAVKPGPSQYIPAPQARQAPCPVNGWYEPGLQGVQVMALAPPPEYDPTWHSPETTDSPSCAQYLPGSQGVQEDVFAPEGEYDPAGHHPEMAVSPVPEQYFPGSQGLQPFESAVFW